MRAKKVTESHPASTLRLRGVGKQMEKHLARLGIYSVPDLLLHLPSRYQDRTRIESIRSVTPGSEAVIEGVVQSVEKPTRGRTKLLCELHDGTGRLHLRFFHLMSFQRDAFKPGARLRCYAEIRLGPKGKEMIHPEMKVISPDNPLPIEQHLTPIYPTTEGLSQYMLRKITGSALAWLDQHHAFNELLPTSVLQSLSFPTLKEAIKFVHRPPRETPMERLQESQTIPQQRMVFEELLAHRMSLLQVKRAFQLQPGAVLAEKASVCKAFIAQLPFALTKAQARVTDEIMADLAKPHPMLRLVQGDVGSGKTVVAALALLRAVENGYQGAMMAPTELLAEQHYRTLRAWCEPLGIHVALLSSNVKARERNTILTNIKEGVANLVVGTHALFQPEVVYANLVLVVIDEQHRFGVHQRALLREKGVQSRIYPHQLIMTATPIPRTLAMSIYADLDCSTIDELPPGRTPIGTRVIANTKRDEVVEHIRHACQQGRQAYWVCPLIDESEVINCQAATKTAEQLQKALPELKIGLIHGRMKGQEKEATMRAFQLGQIHLLVATTVIEVGVDVPNASVMIIENAERLGLSQLHQLRGRVGRGSVESHCLLLYQHPLSEFARQRLSVMRETTDGFKIAERDLSLRGPGELLGTKQTGDLNFHVADLVRDSGLFPKVMQAAEVVIREQPELANQLIDRWLGVVREYGNI